jgi:hypothetical protein
MCLLHPLKSSPTAPFGIKWKTENHFIHKESQPAVLSRGGETKTIKYLAC